MENGSVFMYLSVIEGFMICCMLGWEIFWLRRMYQVLWRMPTSEQIEKMVDMLKGDKESIKTALVGIVGAFEPLKVMFSSLTGGMMGSKLDK